MSFFKMLSDDPADYEHEDVLDDIDSFDLAYSDIADHIDFILDTGEQFTVPISWIVHQCRAYKLYNLH